MNDASSRDPEPARPAGWPPWVFLLAVAVALLHLLPFLVASSNTPPGWEFTGNLSSLSPDAMQYRVWYGETFEHGFLASNRLTPEANPPHLPLLYFAAVGGLSDALGLPPLAVSEGLGALWAFLLALLVWVAARRFCPPPADLRLVYPVTLLGGGIAAYFLLLESVPGLGHRGFVQKNLVRPAAETGWEIYRGNYTYQALYDTHSGLQWLLALASLLLFHDLLRGRRDVRRLLATAAAYALTAAVHLYTGLVLLAITAGVLLVCRLRRVAGPTALRDGALALGAGGVTLAVLVWIIRSGGLPLSPWRAPAITASALLLAYPLTTLVLLRHGHRLLADRSQDAAVLLGWAGACLLILVSGPYFPYPDRGAITAQLPFTFLAANLWFGAGRRVGRGVVLVVLLLVGPSFLRRVANSLRRAAFRPTAPAVFEGPQHRQVLTHLRTEAHPDDVLLARGPDTRWLAPSHPGRHFCGHFFLTVDFGAREEQMRAFFDRPAELGAAWLRARDIDLVFVGPTDTVDLDADGVPDAGPERFDGVEGLRATLRTPAGVLYRVEEEGR